jgi:hypothetical protein
MSEWSKDNVDQTPFGALSTGGEGSSLYDYCQATNAQFGAGAGWGTANLAVFAPVTLRSAVTVYQLGWINGTAVVGNLDVGIYDKVGNRLVSSGSTAQSGVSSVQTVDTADTTLLPGVYYLAMSSDTASGNAIYRVAFSPTGNIGRGYGMLQQTASAFPLPATATFVGIGSTGAALSVPLIFGAIESAVI